MSKPGHARKSCLRPTRGRLGWLRVQTSRRRLHDSLQQRHSVAPCGGCRPRWQAGVECKGCVVGQVGRESNKERESRRVSGESGCVDWQVEMQQTNRKRVVSEQVDLSLDGESLVCLGDQVVDFVNAEVRCGGRTSKQASHSRAMQRQQSQPRAQASCAHQRPIKATHI